MRFRQVLFALSFALASPATALNQSIGDATYDLCMTLTFGATAVKDQKEACRCAAKTWDDNPPQYSDFLLSYMHNYRATGGDLTKTEQMTARNTGLTASEVNGQAAIMSGELSNVALACG